MGSGGTELDGGHFGAWDVDEAGLPCFSYAPAGDAEKLVLPEGGVRVPWHQVGNDRLIATAHAGGWTTLYSTDRGYWRLSNPSPKKREALGGLWSVLDENGRPLLDPLDPAAVLEARWGVGYAHWSATQGEARVQRRVWAPFGDLPLLKIDLEVEAPPGAHYEERWGLEPRYLLITPLATGWQGPPRSHTLLRKAIWYGMAGASAAGKSLFSAIKAFYGSRLDFKAEYLPGERTLWLEAAYKGPGKGGDPERSSWMDVAPKSLFLSLLGPEGVRCEGKGTSRSASLSVPLEKTTRLSIAMGWGERKELPELLKAARKASLKSDASRWKEQVRIQVPDAPWLEREAPWHGYYLRSAQVRDDYFDAKILPQGSAYGYLQGVHGAPRDYLLACVPLVYLDPDGARDNLRLVMRMTRPDGMIYYSHTGYGKCTGAGMHTAPSDLPLFWMWALSEYVWATGDAAFLDESIPFYPKHAGKSATVRERVVLEYDYLKKKIGVGPHMMLHVGSGDWIDPLSLMVRSRTAFLSKGESGFNSAFAAYVLPRAADLIADSHPQVAQEMKLLAEELALAMGAAWNGRWFLRAWDGRGRSIGKDHLFLDCNAWCLIAGIGDERMRQALVGEIKTLLDDPSPIGATILQKPHWMRLGVLGEGWDCNGGVWAAINGLLCWAYSLHDPELAWRSLYKQSLTAHARGYPNIWYGIWSGPDAYNAHYADRAGETFIHPATPMRDFPVMNSNAHALPLLSLLRCVGVETTRDGIQVTPRLPVKGPWRLETPLLTVESDGAKVTAETRAVAGLGGKAKVLVKA